jgi:peptidyl-prolyl cis-trans isomerase SurA
MKNTKSYLLLILSLILLLQSCKTANTTQKTSDTSPIIMKIGELPIYTKDFNYLYNKNYANSDSAYTEKSLRDYITLYTNFKLKVADAISQKLDSTDEFITEFKGYRKQLAAPYLTDKKVTEDLVRQAYDRMKEEVRASHILVKTGLADSPADTLKAYNKIMEYRKRVLAGEDFGTLAAQYSDDPSAKENKGDLGYFTSLQMVYEFENAAYNSKVGEVSMPIRTQFGYHIIKLIDRRVSQGSVKVAHIMIRANENMSAEERQNAFNRITEIAERLKKGEVWAVLCKQFSEDGGSASNAGELPWFSSGSMIESFANAAFALQTPGQISEPIQTPYGWHLINLIEKKSLEPFDKLEPTIRQRISRDSRSQLTQKAFIDRIKTENKFTEYTKNKQILFKSFDSTLVRGVWQPNEKSMDMRKPLFSIAGNDYPIIDFVNYITRKQVAQPIETSVSFYAASLYNQFVEQTMIAYQEAHLEEKHEDFRQLVNEYRDGILLFKVMEDNVWNRAIKDTVALSAYFVANRNKYMWKERANAVILNAASMSILDSISEMSKANAFLLPNTPPLALVFETTKPTLSASLKQELLAWSANTKSYSDISFVIETSYNSKEKNTLTATRLKLLKQYLYDSLNVDTTKITVKDIGKINVLPKQKPTTTWSISAFSSSIRITEPYFNSSNPLNLKITSGKFEKTDQKVFSKINWEKGTHNAEIDGRYYRVIISSIDEAQPKSIEEARGSVIADFQAHLEEEWLTSLRQKYPVQLKEEELKKLIKK